MKCLIFIVTTTIACQITASHSGRRDRGYWNRSPEFSININPNDPFIHPPWWPGPNKVKPGQHGPFDSREATEISHGEYIDSSEEIQQETRQAGSTRTPGYVGPGWWKPQSSSTTQRNTPTRPQNQIGNDQEQIMLCMRSCLVTAEYNPVCGSNNVTYANPGRLECERICGIDVYLISMTACSESAPNQPVLDPRVVNCIRNCPVTTEYDPICGSNNITYANHGKLQCEQYCGIPVQFIKRGPCSNVEEPIPRPLTSEEQVACMRSCPVTGEYNPVCGSNNVTYSNPGRLECAQNCGIAVTPSKLGSCGVSEPVITTETTIAAEGFAAICMRSCPVTSEYNPVCGSNNVTYANLGRLECAQNCGVVVTLIRQTSCEASTTAEENKNITIHNNGITTEQNFVITTSSTSPRPYVNTNGDNTNMQNNVNKHNNDNGNSKNKENNIFDDGKNEKNVGKDGNGDNDYNCQGIENNKKPPSLKEVMVCMQTCTLTSELNPVCGTDSVTYMNPGRLLCAQFCGVDVKVKKFAPCGSSSVTNVHCLSTCTNPPVTDKPVHITLPTHSIEACMEACPASPEFKPVCGSNNVTYRNLEKLQCAIRCGIDVSIKSNTYCTYAEMEPNYNDNTTLVLECINRCSVSHKYEPICGSNNVTYNNTEHLVCARQCGLDVEVKQLHACSNIPHGFPTPSTSTTTEKEQVTKPGHNGLNFTIDPDVLANIFGPTTPKNNDDDEDLELDQRVQDKS